MDGGLTCSKAGYSPVSQVHLLGSWPSSASSYTWGRVASMQRTTVQVVRQQ